MRRLPWSPSRASRSRVSSTWSSNVKHLACSTLAVKIMSGVERNHVLREALHTTMTVSKTAAGVGSNSFKNMSETGILDE